LILTMECSEIKRAFIIGDGREKQQLCKCLQSVATIPQQGHMHMTRLQPCTLRLILSICRFWFSSSDPISIAMLRRLPIIVFTCPMFSSISSSRASFVILDLNIAYNDSNQKLSWTFFIVWIFRISSSRSYVTGNTTVGKQ
jgi:hypothetical protein